MQIRVPITGVPGPAGPQGPAGASGVPTAPWVYAVDVADPIATWSNANAGGRGLKIFIANSNRSSNLPVLQLVNAADSERTFQFFGEEAILQIGPTPPDSQWPQASNAFAAPLNSGGPKAMPRDTYSMYMFGRGGTAIQLISNFANPGGAANTGPNQQTGIGRDGVSSLGKLRQGSFGVGGDGGFRFFANWMDLPIRVGTGNVSKTAFDVTPGDGGIVTFTSAAHGAEVGNAVYVQADPTKQTSLMEQLTATTFRGNNSLAWASTGPFEVHGGQQIDTNRGTMKWGTDSSGMIFGIKNSPPLSSANQGTNYGDYDIIFNPSGWDVADMGRGSRADIGVKGKGQALGFYTGRTDATDDRKTIMILHPWETAYGGSAGNAEFYGQIRAQGGLAGGIAPLWIKPMAGSPAGGFQKVGDVWFDSVADAYKAVFNGGVVKTFQAV